MKTCAFYTLGCKVNQYETQSIRENFIAAGYREVAFSAPADVYIINTCTVTEKTDKESRRLIRDAYRENPAAKIIVTGCYAEINEDEVRNIPGVYLIVKNEDKPKIAGLINPQSKKNCPKLEITDFKDRTRAFLKVQDGCDNFCSYCKVPLVRGRSRSRSVASSVAELKRLVARNFREIVLTGICLGAWGGDLSPKKTLNDLLEELIKVEGDCRIRLSSIEPKYADGRLAALMESSQKLCRHLHIPVQSGDDEILKLMNRPYTAKRYIGIADVLRKKIPDISITTDALVGFPHETEAHFQNTYSLIEKIKPSRVHIFPYSRRDGTRAASMGDEPSKEEVRKRVSRLKELTEAISLKYRENFLQKETNVLVECRRDKSTGLLTGYDGKYIKVLLEGCDDYKSKIVPVRVERVEKERTFGVIIKPGSLP